MKEELQEALRALEKNLKDIQAANETVKAVRKQAADDIQAAGDVIKRINQEIDIIDSHFSNWLESFDTTTKGTFQTFETKALESVKKLNSLNDTLKSHMDSNLESMSESNRLLFQKYEAAWEKHNLELNRVFLKVEELKQTIASLQSAIEKVDFPSRLDKISEEIVQANTKLDALGSKQGSNFTILAVIGTVIIILQLIAFFI